MRKLLSLTLGLFLFIGAYSQPNMRTTAFNHLRYGKLDKAKEAIDKAIEHPKTINDERTWFFYGNIYLAIHLSDEAAYKELDANALDKAYNAYKKALEFDAKGSNTEEINERLVVCAEQYFNRGVGFYNESKFAEASSAFENAGMINAGVGITDTISYFYTAQSAYFSDQYDISKNYFGKLVSMNYKEPAIYRFLAEIYKSESDTTQALKCIHDGRSKFPDDFGLIIEETNIYLASNEKEKAMELLQLAITKDDKNPTLFFAVGANYDQMGDFDEAEKNYKKSLELDPEFFDSNYNLGALYVNKAITITEEANALPLNEEKKYNELKEQSDELLEKSLPYLEKADELKPNDIYVLRTLRDIYARLNHLDTLREIEKKIDKD
jgi:tetratricopeptide (TPR) repeat protein